MGSRGNTFAGVKTVRNTISAARAVMENSPHVMMARAALMEYAGMSLQAAAEKVILEKLVAQKATGGIVALDADGNVAMVFNTPGMYRGFRKSGDDGTVAIFGE